MKNLTRINFSIFAVLFFASCEPEDISSSINTKEEIDVVVFPIGETGDDDDEVYNKEDHKNG